MTTSGIFKQISSYMHAVHAWTKHNSSHPTGFLSGAKTIKREDIHYEQPRQGSSPAPLELPVNNSVSSLLENCTLTQH